MIATLYKGSFTALQIKVAWLSSSAFSRGVTMSSSGDVTASASDNDDRIGRHSNRGKPRHLVT